MVKRGVRSWEYLPGGRIVVNCGERTIQVHPNMPRWIVAANMARAANTSAGLEKAFVLSITDRCNIRCDFCCHPHMDSAFDEADSVRLVTEACDLPFDEICVTGGEPYLRRRLVYRLASICKERGRLFGSITNGFWARDRGRAFELAREMVEHGIARTTFSWDPSHGAFVSPQTVQNGVDGCMAAGMRVCLTGSFKSANDCHENYGIDVSAYRGYANFSVVNSRAAPAGRGKALTDLDNQQVPQRLAENLVCPGRYVHELVTYARDGLTQPCCSIYAGYDMPQLRIGDWRKQSVGDLLDAQQGDGYYRVIVDGGFGLLYEVLRERAPEVAARLPDPRSALSVCQLCESVMTGGDADTIRKVCDQYVTDRLVEVITENAPLFASVLPASQSGEDLSEAPPAQTERCT